MLENITQGHPVHTYLLETQLIHELVKELENVDVTNDYQKYYNIFNHLSTVEKRFARKENQLFPFLEKEDGLIHHKICGLFMTQFVIYSAL